MTQAEKEALAREMLNKHHSMFIPAIKELRATLNCGLRETKELVDIARGLAPSKVNDEQFMREVRAKAEADAQAARAEAARHPHNWNASGAEKWLRKYAAHLVREAKFIRDNARGFSENEEEFRCGLVNGLGIDDEEEQDEIITKIHEKIQERADKQQKERTKS